MVPGLPSNAIYDLIMECGSTVVCVGDYDSSLFCFSCSVVIDLSGHHCSTLKHKNSDAVLAQLYCSLGSLIFWILCLV